MNANELRIGSFVHHPLTKDNFQINHNNLNDFAKNFVTYKPIPVTEEWLLKFGFKHQNKYDLESNLYSKKLKSEYYFTIYSKTETLDFKTKFIGWKVLNTGFDIKIDFVHQLQNLYFALTGEELKPQRQ